MAKDLKGSGVTINALNPGFIKSNLLNNGTRGLDRIIGIPYMFLFASKTEVGFDRILRLALSKEFDGVTGKIIYEDTEKVLNPVALDDSLVEQIWEISKEHVKI